MKLTLSMIHAGANGPGGWNADQLAIIGVEWPPPHGWKQQAIGREISEADYRKFVALKGQKKKERRARAAGQRDLFASSGAGEGTP